MIPRLTKRRIVPSSLWPTGVAEFQSLFHEIQGSNTRNVNLLHGPGENLFTEGEASTGAYILLTGRATISISSRGGKIIILRVARSGDVLGLNSTIRNCIYDSTVRTLEPCHTDFISRAELIELMEKSHRGTQAISMILSRELTELGNRAKSLLLPQTSSARLAKLLLELSSTSDIDHSPLMRIDKGFTQEDMAQMIGSSRETVSRGLAALSRRQIIQVTTDSILIRDWAALEMTAEG